MVAARTRLLVVDDHPVVVAGLVAVLSQEADLEIVGTANDGQSALAAVDKHHPDVVLLDLMMPAPSGAELIGMLAEIAPETQVIVLTTYDDQDALVETLQAGARGYLLKGSPTKAVVEAIHEVREGRSRITPELAHQLADHLSKQGRQTEPNDHRVTAREREVLAELVRGRSNRDIAQRLYVSERTVKAHLASIYRKLDVHDRAGAAAAAVELGLASVRRTVDIKRLP